MTNPADEQPANVGKNTKGQAMTFLSDVIDDVELPRRGPFVRNLKTALRTGVIEGAPTADTFTLKYLGRNEKGKPSERNTEQGDYFILNTPAFQDWFSKQLTLGKRGTHALYPSKADLQSGKADAQEAIKLFRRRAGKKTK